MSNANNWAPGTCLPGCAREPCRRSHPAPRRRPPAANPRPPRPAVARRLRDALTRVLTSEDALRDSLVTQLGFAVKEASASGVQALGGWAAGARPCSSRGLPASLVQGGARWGPVCTNNCSRSNRLKGASMCLLAAVIAPHGRPALSRLPATGQRPPLCR